MGWGWGGGGGRGHFHVPNNKISPSQLAYPSLSPLKLPPTGHDFRNCQLLTQLTSSHSLLSGTAHVGSLPVFLIRNAKLAFLFFRVPPSRVPVQSLRSQVPAFLTRNTGARERKTRNVRPSLVPPQLNFRHGLERRVM